MRPGRRRRGRQARLLHALAAERAAPTSEAMGRCWGFAFLSAAGDGALVYMLFGAPTHRDGSNWPGARTFVRWTSRSIRAAADERRRSDVAACSRQAPSGSASSSEGFSLAELECGSATCEAALNMAFTVVESRGLCDRHDTIRVMQRWRELFPALRRRPERSWP